MFLADNVNRKGSWNINEKNIGTNPSGTIYFLTEMRKCAHLNSDVIIQEQRKTYLLYSQMVRCCSRPCDLSAVTG